ncbi:MAG TPA: hypothetical protein VFG10_17255 [Saprospiraceae bacterium]|nr:hypothetical protein [Saprospiraceae bacterium]
MNEVIFVVNESDEGGFTASALGYSIITQAEAWNELREQVKDAVKCHFDDDVSRIITLHFVKDEVLSI